MSTNLIFTGDVWAPERFSSDISREGEFVVNLEAPICDPGNGVRGKILLRTAQNNISHLLGRRPLVACLANNHIMDYGEGGLEATCESLQLHGTKYYGAGALGDNCGNPLILDYAGQRIAFMGYVCPTANPVFATGQNRGVARLELTKILEDCELAYREGATRIVVSLHWGAEETSLPRPQDVRIAQALLRAGVDLVVGHHSHVVQPVIQEGSSVAFFGLGNFVFPDFDRKHQRSWNRRSLLIDYDVVSREWTPLWADFRDGRIAAAVGASVRMLPAANRYLYPLAYLLAKTGGACRYSASCFLDDPKLPRIRHLLSLARSIKR